ncbi:MAG: hypothetical protein R3186_09835, partial [Ruegeria sp.]|nr:hypothetical protein [Ruegeria sp.]
MSFRTFAALLSLTLLASEASAENVEFKIANSFPVKGKQLPFSLYLSVEDSSDTRLGIEAFMDLRSLQKNAPWIFSNVLKDTCKQKYSLAVSEAKAQGDTIVASGQVQAKFHACDTDDPEVYYRGVLLFGQNVDAVVQAAADVRGKCARLRLVDLELDLHGFVGTVADLTGVTEKVSELILEKGAEILAKHPICPKLPDELAGLDPYFNSGGIREIGQGGVGVTLVGSV